MERPNSRVIESTTWQAPKSDRIYLNVRVLGGNKTVHEPVDQQNQQNESSRQSGNRNDARHHFQKREEKRQLKKTENRPRDDRVHDTSRENELFRMHNSQEEHHRQHDSRSFDHRAPQNRRFQNDGNYARSDMSPRSSRCASPQNSNYSGNGGSRRGNYSPNRGYPERNRYSPDQPVLRNEDRYSDRGSVSSRMSGHAAKSGNMDHRRQSCDSDRSYHTERSSNRNISPRPSKYGPSHHDMAPTDRSHDRRIQNQRSSNSQYDQNRDDLLQQQESQRSQVRRGPRSENPFHFPSEEEMAHYLQHAREQMQVPAVQDPNRSNGSHPIKENVRDNTSNKRREQSSSEKEYEIPKVDITEAITIGDDPYNNGSRKLPTSPHVFDGSYTSSYHSADISLTEISEDSDCEKQSEIDNQMETRMCDRCVYDRETIINIRGKRTYSSEFLLKLEKKLGSVAKSFPQEKKIRQPRPRSSEEDAADEESTKSVQSSSIEKSPIRLVAQTASLVENTVNGAAGNPNKPTPSQVKVDNKNTAEEETPLTYDELAFKKKELEFVLRYKENQRAMLKGKLDTAVASNEEKDKQLAELREESAQKDEKIAELTKQLEEKSKCLAEAIELIAAKNRELGEVIGRHINIVMRVSNEEEEELQRPLSGFSDEQLEESEIEQYPDFDQNLRDEEESGKIEPEENRKMVEAVALTFEIRDVMNKILHDLTSMDQESVEEISQSNLQMV